MGNGDRLIMNWYVVYEDVDTRFNKIVFVTRKSAFEFFDKRRHDYPNLKVFLPDQIGFYESGHSKEFLELVGK